MAVPVFEEATPIYASGDAGVTVDYGDLTTINANDILLLRGIDADDDSFTTPSGWTKETGAEHTTNTNCSDVWFWKRATGSESGTFALNSVLSAGQVVGAIMERYSGCITSGNPIEQFLDTAVVQSTTCTIPAISDVGTNVLLVVHNNVEDNMSTAQATDYTEQYDVGSTTGSDFQFQLQTKDMASGGSVVERTCTISGNDYHGVFLIALKGVGYTPPPLAINTSEVPTVADVITIEFAAEFQMSDSTYISASGENTTYQLTAPATKSTTDFDAGRIQDDENPADTVDITADDYTEMEWCFKGTDLSKEVQYDFRVVKSDDTDLDTYTVTPQLTLSFGVGAFTVDVSDDSYCAESIARQMDIGISVSECSDVEDVPHG
jgi:hypothetical protein